MLKSPDERAYIFARLNRANKQDVGRGELIARLRLGNRFCGYLCPKLIVNAVIDRFNSLQRYPQLLRNLLAGLVGDGHNACDTPGAWQGQVLPVIEAGTR